MESGEKALRLIERLACSLAKIVSAWYLYLLFEFYLYSFFWVHFVNVVSRKVRQQVVLVLNESRVGSVIGKSSK